MSNTLELAGRGGVRSLSAYVRLLRPKQWSKNLLAFAAILFTGDYRDPRLLGMTLLAFAAMCLFSSGSYVVNDLRDVDKDRKHPTKKSRPIAAGLVSPAAASAIAALCFLAGAAIILAVGKMAAIVVAAYLILQIFYNLSAKTVPILDVFLIGSGFVLRAVLGAAAIHRTISAWLLLCTGALALLLGFAKRRHEFVLQGEERAKSRASLAGYSRQSLDALVIMSATAAALCYGLYALQSSTALAHPALFITAIFVFYGICRYVLIVFVSDEGGEPETLLFKDRHILGSVVLFIVAAAIAVSTHGFPLIDIGAGR